MAKRSMSARIAPGMELHEIRVVLDRFGPPRVELRGTVVGIADRRAAAASSSVVTTMWLPPSGEAFIDEIRAAFATAQREVTHQ